MVFPCAQGERSWETQEDNRERLLEGNWFGQAHPMLDGSEKVVGS